MDRLPIDQKLAGIRQRMASHRREDVILAEMWCWHDELSYQAITFANAKTYHGREVSKVVIKLRAEGERSAEVARESADNEDHIYNAHVAYRTAEQLIVGCREALKILHAELDKIRTDRADQRAADLQSARTGT